MFNVLILGNFWASKENRREFLDRFAREQRFDPLIADNWYGIVPSSKDYRSTFQSSNTYHGTVCLHNFYFIVYLFIFVLFICMLFIMH